MKKRLLIVASIALPLLLAATLLYQIDPGGGIELVPCPIYKITGFYCPGCGMARATHALLHLRFYEAFRFHPLSPLFWLAAGCYLGAHAVDYLTTGQNHIDHRLPPAVLWWALIFLVLFGLARNLPMLPFRLLAPTAV